MKRKPLVTLLFDDMNVGTAIGLPENMDLQWFEPPFTIELRFFSKLRRGRVNPGTNFFQYGRHLSFYCYGLRDSHDKITIAAYENIDIQALLQWTEAFAKAHSALDISPSTLGVFPPYGEHTETAVLFASPSQSKSFVDFYYAFHEKLDDYCGKLGWLYSAKWGYPAIHSSIGVFEVSRIQKAMETIIVSQIFGKAKITALEVYTYPMELIHRFELNN